jgi:hypothetical protein
MSQCDTCGGWFGLTAWTCAACRNLTHYLTSIQSGGH